MKKVLVSACTCTRRSSCRIHSQEANMLICPESVQNHGQGYTQSNLSFLSGRPPSALSGYGASRGTQYSAKISLFFTLCCYIQRITIKITTSVIWEILQYFSTFSCTGAISLLITYMYRTCTSHFASDINP